MAGAPLGNTNKADNKRFKLALIAALEKRGLDKVAGLQELADKMIAEGLEGNVTAICEVRNTLDGKPSQQVALTDPEGNALTIKLIQDMGNG